MVSSWTNKTQMRAIVEKSVGAKDEVTILWRYTTLFIIIIIII